MARKASPEAGVALRVRDPLSIEIPIPFLGVQDMMRAMSRKLPSRHLLSQSLEGLLGLCKRLPVEPDAVALPHDGLHSPRTFLRQSTHPLRSARRCHPCSITMTMIMTIIISTSTTTIITRLQVTFMGRRQGSSQRFKEQQTEEGS